MNTYFVPVIVALGSSLVAVPTYAQQSTTDNTQTLPDAKPGECYAKVVTAPKFETRTEEIVLQEATERVEAIPATYETLEQSVVVRESSRSLEVIPAVYEDQSEKIEVKPAETTWTVNFAGVSMPASPGALEGIAQSGIDLTTVNPGACFREYFTPPEYKSDMQQVLRKDASETIEVTPAQFEVVEERVVVKEASTRVLDVPASYRTETESVMVEPARSVWKKGRGPVERIDNSTGEIMCLVELPPRYETVTKTVLVSAATTKTVEVPAVYKSIKVSRLVKPATEVHKQVEPEYTTVSVKTKVSDAGFFWLKKGETANANAEHSGREVCLVEQKAEFTTIKKKKLISPASVKVTEMPAKYTNVKIERLVTPASERRMPVAARVKTVTRQTQTEPSKLEWRKVLCETNMTPKMITSIQRALKREGYDPGPIDGVIGQTTLDALEQYQSKNKLDRGGITYESLKSLKVQS